MKKIIVLMCLIIAFSSCKKDKSAEPVVPRQIYCSLNISQKYGSDKMTCELFISGENLGTVTIDWGDGTAKSKLNYGILAMGVHHTYSSAGTYSITAVGTNSSVVSSVEYVPATQSLTFVAISIDYPVASFTANISGLTVDFTNTSQHAKRYLWSFGDGTTSEEKSPSHTYSQDGTYNVQLICFSTIDGEVYDSSASKSVLVKELKPKAAFAIQTAQPLKVVLTNNSSNATSYLWNFGDGSTSTEESPTHKYATIGNYVITLTVSNTKGQTDSYQQSVLITAPATCYFTGITVQSLYAYNLYYKFKWIDGGFTSIEVFNGNGIIMTKNQMPYDVTWPKMYAIDFTETSYLIYIYSTSNPNLYSYTKKYELRYQVSTIKTYPEHVTTWDSNGNKITINLLWK